MALTTPESIEMLRHQHHRQRTAGTVSDRELGIAALLLLLGMVLTVAFLPSLI